MQSQRILLPRSANPAALTGAAFMLSAAVLFSVLDLLVKQINPAYEVWHIGFFRFFGGVVLLLTLFGGRRDLFKGEVRLLVIRGATGSIAFLTIATAIRMLPVSTALVIFYSYPAFSAIFSYFLYGERIGKMQMICIASVMVGVGILFDFHPHSGYLGQFMAVLGSLFAGLTVTFVRALRKTTGSVVIYLSFCIMGSLVTLPSFIMNPILPTNLTDTVMVLGIILSSLVAQLLMNQGFAYCKGWEGGVLMSSEVVFTALVGICFLGDPVGWRFWMGGLMIFGSVLLLNRANAGSSISDNPLVST
jgi:drug/metabolite transporter (DMT)-like permease